MVYHIADVEPRGLLLSLACIAPVPLAGCSTPYCDLFPTNGSCIAGEESSTGSSGETETDGDGNTETGGDNNNTGDGDGDMAEDGDTTGDGDGDGDVTGDGTLLVEGKVTDFFLMSGIEGASISVKDVPGFETVSDAEGDYAIAGMPANTELYFLIDGNEESHWGGVIPASLPNVDIDDLELGQVSNELLDLQLGIVMQQDMDIMVDETKGIVMVRVLQPTAIDPGVDSVAVSFDPPLAMNQYYGVDSNNNPVLGSDLIDSQLLPFWGFVAKTCSGPTTAAFWLRALGKKSGARSRKGLHHGLLAQQRSRQEAERRWC